MDICQGLILAGAQDHFFSAQKACEGPIKDVDLAAQFFFCRRLQIFVALQQFIK